MNNLMNRPLHYYSFSAKHAFYLGEMNKCDLENKRIKRDIMWLSSKSTAAKNAKFHAAIDGLNVELRDNQEIRERYRLLVRRYKETIKNQNRHKNGPY